MTEGETTESNWDQISIVWLFDLLSLSLPDGVYFRNVSCTLIQISKFCIYIFYQQECSLDGPLHILCFFSDWKFTIETKRSPMGNEGCFLYMYVEHLLYDQNFLDFFFIFLIKLSLCIMYYANSFPWFLTFLRYKAKTYFH